MRPLAAMVVLLIGFGANAQAQRVLRLMSPERLRPGVDTMRIVRSTESAATGLAITSLERESPAVLRLRFVYTFPQNIRAVVLTRLRRSDLAPLEEVHDYGGGDSARVIFRADRAIARHWGPESRPTTDSTMLPRGTVSSASIDLVLRSLPLASDFATELPVYFLALYAVKDVPIHVTGVETVRTSGHRMIPCWVVEGTFPGPAVERFWIAQRSREIVRIVGHASPTVIERFER